VRIPMTPRPTSAATSPDPGDADGERVLLPLDRDACLALLETVSVGRLVFTYRAMPEVFPVNFRLDDGGVVIRVSGASRTAVNAVDTVVAFEADEIDAATRTGWSVTVVGQSREILDPHEQARVAALPLVAWAGGARDRFIRIALERVTGRRLTSDAA
jgi:hypothetical protein